LFEDIPAPEPVNEQDVIILDWDASAVSCDYATRNELW
jgi:hypothetical protein